MQQELSLEKQPLACGHFEGEIVPSFGTEIKRNLRLFWPILLGQLSSSAMGVVDTIMAGMSGTIELSGVAIGCSFYWPCVLFLIGMTLAIQPTIAHLRGAAKTEEIPAKMHLATVVCLSASLLVAGIMLLLPLTYSLLPNVDQDMLRIGKGYVLAVAFSMPIFTMFSVLRAYWEGLGITIPTSAFGLLALLLNIPLNYIFIFGKFGVPAFGGIGCGIATSLTMLICVICMLVYVKKSKHFAKYRLYQQWFPLHWTEVKEFIRFSLPLGISTTIEVACFALVAMLLSPFGPITISAHTIAMNISGMLFTIPLALASAATIRVGEAMGANHWYRSLRSTLGTYILGAISYTFCVLLLVFCHKQIIALYTEDPEVASLATLLIWFCIVYTLPDTCQVIAIGILRGFKDSKTIFIITIIAYWMIGMPVGYALTYGYITGDKMGAPGFWTGFICALSTASLLYIARLLYLYRTHRLPRALLHSQASLQRITKNAISQEQQEQQKQQELKEKQETLITAEASKSDTTNN